MRIIVLSVGKIRDKLVLEAEQTYLSRLPKGWRVELRELGSSPSTSMSADEVKRRESKLVQDEVPSSAYKCILDEQGDTLTSKQFSTMIDKLTASAKQEIFFIIGGAYGFTQEMKTWADRCLSLSHLTLPHQFARLILVEQIYRAYTLQNGIPYHKQ